MELPEASSTLVQLGEEQSAIEADLLQACTTVRVLATQVEAVAGSPAPQATSEVRCSWHTRHSLSLFYITHSYTTVTPVVHHATSAVSGPSG